MAELIREENQRKYYASGQGSVIAVASEGRDGRLATRISEFWSDLIDGDPHTYALTATKSTDNSQMDAEFQTEEYDGRCTMMMPLKMIPVECIVRAYLTGSILDAYLSGERVIGGVDLPEGMEAQEKLPDLVFTPARMTSSGHELISVDEMAEIINDSGCLCGANPLSTAILIKQASLDVFRLCADYALSCGIIIADARFRFGFGKTASVGDGHFLIYLGDDIITPDSSRLWERRMYVPGFEMKEMKPAQTCSMLGISA